MNTISKNFPLMLLISYALLSAWSFINPMYMSVWIVEAITSVLTVCVLVFMYYKSYRFSNLAYVFMAVFPVMHMIGAHYTFEFVPFDWFNNLLGSERNMYDRVAHYSVGLYAYGIIEYILAKGLTKSKFLAYTYALFAIMSVACAYELFEWQYAVMSDPTAGLAVLGAQGDIWDAQKDMLMDTLGGVTGVILSILFYKRRV